MKNVGGLLTVLQFWHSELEAQFEKEGWTVYAETKIGTVWGKGQRRAEILNAPTEPTNIYAAYLKSYIVMNAQFDIPPLRIFNLPICWAWNPHGFYPHEKNSNTDAILYVAAGTKEQLSIGAISFAANRKEVAASDMRPVAITEKDKDIILKHTINVLCSNG